MKLSGCIDRESVVLVGVLETLRTVRVVTPLGQDKFTVSCVCALSVYMHVKVCLRPSVWLLRL